MSAMTIDRDSNDGEGGGHDEGDRRRTVRAAGRARAPDVERPALEDDQVLVRVHASSVNPVEWYGVTGPYFARWAAVCAGRRSRPWAPTSRDASRRSAAAVTTSRPGDEVFGTARAPWAEYAAPARAAPRAEAGATSRSRMRRPFPSPGSPRCRRFATTGSVEAGQKVLINGASGGVGTFAVQLAKAFGADVTARVQHEERRAGRSLGADRVVDYTREDFTRSGVHHDLLLDIAGSRSFGELRRVLTPRRPSCSSAGG